jgi:hypothetical protein
MKDRANWLDVIQVRLFYILTVPLPGSLAIWSVNSGGMAVVLKLDKYAVAGGVLLRS